MCIGFLKAPPSLIYLGLPPRDLVPRFGDALSQFAVINVLYTALLATALITGKTRSVDRFDGFDLVQSILSAIVCGSFSAGSLSAACECQPFFNPSINSSIRPSVRPSVYLSFYSGTQSIHPHFPSSIHSPQTSTLHGLRSETTRCTRQCCASR